MKTAFFWTMLETISLQQIHQITNGRYFITKELIKYKIDFLKTTKKNKLMIYKEIEKEEELVREKTNKLMET